MPNQKKSTSPTPANSNTHADRRANIPTEKLGGVECSAFIEIVDPWDAKNTIRAFLKGENVDGVGALLRQNSGKQG